MGNRFGKLYREFYDDEIKEAFEAYRNQRNADLHTGSSDVWSDKSSGKWNEWFYLLARSGVAALGLTLEEFLGEPSQTAKEFLARISHHGREFRPHVLG